MKKRYLHKNLSITLCTLLLASSSLLAQDEANKLEKITVIDKTSSDYLSKEKPTVTRNNISLEDTAKSIQIFNEDFIEDYRPQIISDIITMSSSTLYQGDDHGRQNMFAIRGFSGVPMLRDGFSIDYAIAYPEIFNLERIEVLKGPDSLQFGESSPGGLINLVKKKPLKEDHINIEMELTSNNSYSPKIDIGGALNEDESLRYRVVSIYKKGEGVKDYNFDEDRFFIAPSLAYDINDNHTFTLSAEYLDETKHSDFGTFIKSDGTLAAPSKTVTSHPDEKLYKEQKIIGFDLASNFDSWNSLFKYRYVDYEIDNPNVHMPFGYNETTNQITKFFATQKREANEHAIQYTANKELEIANTRHRISAGIDARKSDYEYVGYVDLTQPYTIDLSNISYESLTSLSDHPNANKYLNEEDEIKRYGGFIQDSIDITDKVILSTALRYDKVDPKNNEKSDALLPQLGLVYKITPQTTLYTNFSESFNPQTVTNSSGKILDPEEGKGYEVGIKQKLFDSNFNLTTALFKIQKENVAMTDPNNTLFSVSSGKQESRGIELDLTGEISSGWSLIASYGYTRTEDKSTNAGKDLAGVPKHSANIFTTYNLKALGLPNMHVGAGVRYIGSRYANDTNTIKIDSNMIYNATIGYKKGSWQANLNIQNLTDEEYAQTARSTRATAGTRRTIVAALSYKF